MLLNAAYKRRTSIIRNVCEWEYLWIPIWIQEMNVYDRCSTYDDTTSGEVLWVWNWIAHALCDFTQAFDHVLRHKMAKAMRRIDVPENIVLLIMTMTENSKSKVYTVEGTTNDIYMGRGVRQGGVLSAILFNIVLNRVLDAADMKKMEWRTSYTSLRMQTTR